MRRALDTLYKLSGGIAAALIVAICLLITAQIGMNLSSRLLGPGWGGTIPSYADFAGFMLAGASFLALAHTLRMGGHVRVSLVTQKLTGRAALVAELLCLAVATGIAGYACYYLVSLVQESLHYGDTSSGIVPIPLWIPQVAVAAGMAVLVIALLDALVETARAGGPVLPDSAEE